MYEPEAWIHGEEYVHDDCLTDSEREVVNDPDQWHWYPVWSHNETDIPNHCVRCGGIVEETLTREGELFVTESIVHAYMDAIETGTVNPVAGAQWVDAYVDDYDLRDRIADMILDTLARLPLDRHPAFALNRQHVSPRGREVARAGGGDLRGAGGGSE